MEVKKLNRLKVVMAEKDLSNIWLSEKLGVSQADDDCRRTPSFQEQQL